MQQVNVVLEEFKNAKKGDVLVFDGKKWQPVAMEKLLEPIIKKLARQEELETQFNVLKKQVAFVLKEDTQHE